MRILIFFTAILFFCACGRLDKSSAAGSFAMSIPEPRETITGEELHLPVYDFNGLEPLLNRDDETIYVVNFWATWCAPCVKEMPYFEQIASEYEPEELQVILVNLDMPAMWETKLLPFVKERNLKSQVVILDDPDQNSWIPRVDADWSGAIPATLIYQGDRRIFYEKAFTYEGLREALSTFTSSQ